MTIKEGNLENVTDTEPTTIREPTVFETLPNMQTGHTFITTCHGDSEKVFELLQNMQTGDPALTTRREDSEKVLETLPTMKTGHGTLMTYHEEGERPQMELFILEIGNSKLDTQGYKTTYECTLEEYKMKEEADITANPDLELISSQYTLGESSILIEYRANPMDKVITRYITPVKH